MFNRVWIRFASFTSLSVLSSCLLLLTIVLLIGLANQPARAQTETVLHSFKDGLDGSLPSAGVVRDQLGNLYGTTPYGGTSGVGTVFKISSIGKTVLHNFERTDGENPYGLVIDAEGNLYGVAQNGGGRKCVHIVSGCGVVFKLDTSGTLTVLHAFAGPAKDGDLPFALALDGKGNIYGVTSSGGTGNSGTVFKVDSTGKESVLYSFKGKNVGDGETPNGVAVDSVGNVYGTTLSGGAYSMGTVFKVDSSGNETILHSFSYSIDGGSPGGGIAIDAAGNVYCTTQSGGVGSDGTLFKIDSSGNGTVLYSFNTRPFDGQVPQSLALDAAGNIYGTTVFGGANALGTVFEYDTSGNETVLHSFDGADGTNPYGALAVNRTSRGVVVFGATLQGGAYGWGTVFAVAP